MPGCATEGARAAEIRLQLIGDRGQTLRVVGHVGADGGNELGVAEEELEVGLDVRIPVPDVTKGASEAFERIRCRLPRPLPAGTGAAGPVARAGGEEHVLFREMRIDGVPLDARLVGDR